MSNNERTKKAKLKTYSKRRKSLIKINTFYFILKQKGKKGGVTGN